MDADNKTTLKKISVSLRFGGLLILLLFLSLVAATYFGSEKLAFFELTDAQTTILFDIRLPRVLLGACVGASLAVAGASLQSLLRNPLAEPYLLGVSNGAALGTMLAFVFFRRSKRRARFARLREPVQRLSRCIKWRNRAPEIRDCPRHCNKRKAAHATSHCFEKKREGALRGFHFSFL